MEDGYASGASHEPHENVSESHDSSSADKEKTLKKKKKSKSIKKVEWKEYDALDWLAGKKTFALGYVWQWIHETQST